MVVMLFATFGFLTGFVSQGNIFNPDIAAYSTTDSITSDESGDDEQGEDIKANKENEQEIKTWECGDCGLKYVPAPGDPVNGIPAGPAFEDLPDTWVCPVCNAPKAGFEDEESLDQKTPEEWLAHLAHVLAMRSKHLVVLQRVIEAKIAKNNNLNSIISLGHALISSSKSVQKAQAAYDEYDAYIKSLTPPTTEPPVTSGQTLSNDESQNTLTDEKNGNGNNGNDNKNDKENNSNGKAKGKNK